MNELQLPPTRTCLWCTTPLQGRADKKFCSSSCKASYGRTTTSTILATPVITTTSSSSTIEKMHHAAEAKTSCNDWQALYGHVEDALEENQQGFLLHQSYANIVGWFLRFENHVHTITALDYMIQQAVTVSESYQQHHSLRVIGHVAHRRFADLIFTHNCMYQVRERRLTGEQQLLGGFPWSGPNDVTLVWGINHGQRDAMWQNLLEIA